MEKETKKTTKTTTKKNATKKAETIDNSVIEALLKEIADLKEKINKQEDKPKTEVKEDKKNKKFGKINLKDLMDTEVEVERVLDGIGDIVYIDKNTGCEYTWTEKGSTEYMTVEVLRRMNNKSSLFLKSPWLKIVDNDDVVEALGLTKLYKNISLVEDVNTIIELEDGEIIELIKELPNEYKNILSTNVLAKIISGELNNINEIRRLERLLGKEFSV